MKTMNFYRQMRIDGGRRTGIEIDGEAVMERFEEGTESEDPALLWFVDIRCSGDSLPGDAGAAREWFLKKSPLIQAGIRAAADELQAGIDFASPVSRPIPNAGAGVTIQIFCSAIRRVPALKIAEALTEISLRWVDLLNSLEVLEPMAH